MKKTLLALALAGLTTSGALAADAAPAAAAPEPIYTITGNYGLFSDYRFRGISQSKKGPAVQGGFDFAHKSGLYLGTWTSSVSDWANTGGNGQELDLYGGYKYAIGAVTLDVGYLAYIYPGNTPASGNLKQGTREFYIGASYGPFTYKASRTTGNWFGAAGSSGSVYHDVALTQPLNEKLSVVAHVGFQDVKGSTDLGFTDYKVGLAYDLGDAYSLGLAYVNTSSLTTAGKNAFTQNANGTGKKLYDGGAVLSITKTF